MYSDRNQNDLCKMVQCGMENEHRSAGVLEVRRSEERSFPPAMCRLREVALAEEAFGDFTSQMFVRAGAFGPLIVFKDGPAITGCLG